MRKTIAAGIVTLSFVVLVAANATPVSALTAGEIQAQIQELFSRLMALQPTAGLSADVSASSNIQSQRPRVCGMLSRSLTIGARGEDVASLQEFLGTEGYFSAQATGYFGPLTMNALMRWQASQGVNAAGVAGPMTRARIMMRCGNPPPVCRPVNYLPPRCDDGSAPQPVHDVNGCTTGYVCPVANFTPPANCKTWNDGCNICSRQYPGGPAACTLRACLADQTTSIWAGKGYCSAYFDDTGNRPPTISSFSGPTTLAVNASGTWTIRASDPENGSLSYSVTWGDEYRNVPPYASTAAQENFVQTTTFTHVYAASGTYTVTVVVRDASGLEARTSSTVRVGSEPTFCTMQYDPVCGQPPEPACRRSIPACMMPDLPPQTYGNRCVLEVAGATYLYSGECRT